MTKALRTIVIAGLIGGVACTGGSMARVAPAPAAAPLPATAPAAGDGRVLVRSASLSVEVQRIETALAEITSFTTRSGGYVESSSRHSEGSARLILRVPSATLDATLDSIGRAGHVEGRSVVATDVTTRRTSTHGCCPFVRRVIAFASCSSGRRACPTSRRSKRSCPESSRTSIVSKAG